MCGRYTHYFTWKEVYDYLNIFGVEQALSKRYNVAPTQKAPVVRLKDDSLHLDLLRWGLIPPRSPDMKVGARMINARAETVATVPSYKSPFRSKRCAVPISGFYEWKKITSKEKQPFYFTGIASPILLLAGLWENWKSPEGESLDTFTIITIDANEVVSAVHNRMPVILDREKLNDWLSPNSELPTLINLLKPCPSDLLRALAVSKRVNKTENDDQECIEGVNSSQDINQSSNK